MSPSRGAKTGTDQPWRKGSTVPGLDRKSANRTSGSARRNNLRWGGLHLGTGVYPSSFARRYGTVMGQRMGFAFSKAVRFQMLRHVFVLTIATSIVACGAVAANAEAPCAQSHSARQSPSVRPPSGAPVPKPSPGGPAPIVQPPSGNASIIPQSRSGHAMNPQPFSGTLPVLRQFSSVPAPSFQPGSKPACISLKTTERDRPA